MCRESNPASPKIAASFPITYPIVTTAVNYISRFLLTRDGIASEVRGQMKSAVFYFDLSGYLAHRKLAEVRGERPQSVAANRYVRVAYDDRDCEEALFHAKAKPGETVLNSVLLEE